VFDAILVSPLKRAIATCRLSGFLDKAEIVPDLRERSYGDFEGLTWPQILAIAPEWSIWGPPAPNGESVEDAARRAREVLSRLDAIQGRAALFAHGHLLRVLAACWLGLTPDLGRLFAMDTATVGVLARENGRPVIRRWGVPPDGQLR
jgi:probable phosphoglycerate mutase